MRLHAAYAVVFSGFGLSDAAALDSLPADLILEETYVGQTSDSSQAIPIGPYQNGFVTFVTVDGHIAIAAYRSAPSPTLTILEHFQEHILGQGYEVLFRCHQKTCGGFDFRASIDIVHAPAMFVDLSDYRHITAERQNANGRQLISILVSRSADAGHVQLILATELKLPDQSPLVGLPSPTTNSNDKQGDSSTDSFAENLKENGYVVLENLRFESGSAELGDGNYRELDDIAKFIAKYPNSLIVLVGHTDARDSLESNIKLSQRRAESVLQRLVDSHGVTNDRISAEGIGYLAPRASNASPEGRQSNRRVVAILLSID